MRVGSELKDAFVEASSNVEVDCTKKAQIKYDDTSGALAVGNGSEAEYIITSQHKTLGDLRSAFYPTGSFIHSLLDEGLFREFMGDDSMLVPQVEKKWREVSTLLTDVTSTNYVLIEESTTLGAYLITTAAVQIDIAGTLYRRMANVKGRYLRSADPAQTKDGIILNSNVPMNDAIQSHNHSGTFPGNGGQIYDSGGNRQAASYFSGNYGVGSTGGNETRPETAVCNLYIKVNE